MDLAGQSLLQTVAAVAELNWACRAQHERRERRHEDWCELAAELPVPAAESETPASFAAASWRV